jgi:predicted flap endonuclease-1-like 5' DNA nuclease
MSTLLILLALTKGAATFEILTMLLGSAVIGYLTAWLYSKSIYEKRIKIIESDKHELNNRIVNLDGIIVDLRKSIEEKDKVIEQLNLVYISQRKHLIDYSGFGTATLAEKDNLQLISGIGPFIEARLHAVDIYTFRQISNFNKADIQMVTEAIEYFPGRIERDEWIYQAKEMIRIAGDKVGLLKRIRERKDKIYYDRLGFAHKQEADNLTQIDGLGLWVEERLNTLDIYTFSQISKLTHEDIEIITEVLELIPGRIEQDNWVAQARELAKNTQILMVAK